MESVLCVSITAETAIESNKDEPEPSLKAVDHQEIY